MFSAAIGKQALTAAATLLLVTGCYFEARETGFGREDTVFSGKRAGQKTEPFVSGLSKTTDIHYSAKYCQECHLKTPEKGGNKQLQYGGDYRQLCRCHYSASENYIHPVDITPSESLRPRIPAEFPLQDGQINCGTCHDIFVQCKDAQAERIFTKEQKFLRGAPYQALMDICYKCHNKAAYQKYNPHLQLNAGKQILKQTCLYCHSEVPDEQVTTLQDAKLIGNMEALCTRCHMLEPRQVFHAKHLRKPSEEVVATINSMKSEHGILLPLSEDGQITCATCHNPHQQDVIPDRRLGATGAGQAKRHRLQKDMCIKCHPMREITPLH